MKQQVLATCIWGLHLKGALGSVSFSERPFSKKDLPPSLNSADEVRVCLCGTKEDVKSPRQEARSPNDSIV